MTWAEGNRKTENSGPDNPQLGNKVFKFQGAFYICCCIYKYYRYAIRKLACLLVIHFPERLVFLNFVKTQVMLFLVFQISIASLLFFIFSVFGFYGNSASFCQEASLSSSFVPKGFEPPWDSWYLGERRVVCLFLHWPFLPVPLLSSPLL